MVRIDSKSIKQRMKEMKIKVSDMAYQAKIDLSTIYKILAGRCYPSYYVMYQIGRVLKLDEVEFYQMFFAPVAEQVRA
ncbi:Helix-turn-helix domain-containing protein [Ignavigranum ruoffiae]|uniref:Helix-turn-helix domain-containing protein n=1 Tax=Ignavigranum ruoffiae TaxID=89093 RepID=A0A1H9H0A6_9LACT|nr:helix-turn-helix transcriptional regulator [Ignavigranum ruoffiae]SEQ55683.1 Helix-turn-helix domain-containing protein [Ignavigranum ruoffiae]